MKEIKNPEDEEPENTQAPPTKNVPPITQIIQTPSVSTNREERHKNMEMAKNEDHNVENFIPDEEDKDFEKKVLIMQCLTEKNKQYANFTANMKDPESLKLLEKGELPTNKTDKQYFTTKTFELYVTAARQVSKVTLQSFCHFYL